MKKMLATVLGSSILAAGMLAASAPAKAATFACSSVISDNVSNTSECEVSNTSSQDFQEKKDKPLTVNTENFFDINNWVFGGKIGETAGYIDLQSQGEGKSGSWDISKVVQNNWEDVMLIFKSAKSTQLVGYMVEDGKTFGTWNSPFEKAAFNFNGNETKDVSHISVYYKIGTGKTQAVPEPGTILGMIAVGMGGLLTRKNSKNRTKEQVAIKVTV
ncbi:MULTISPECIES: PEP-CTERM sorting domain-containing protein [Calothrix]|uniref:PEP-CTERM sorting domain-containing protein n=2 Tax=Calothrix TaxID=1186 RepID=A0ABR8AAX5_9CYAN|nr:MULTISPECIES: PEP-CTERM sorting domain-containing protein [Calothrix]MBD2195922.1 PEP-CTERM sorting domain-containing protein [Calothrix parietina FACHB-288]MBD2227636.1 PEP-CTERM sorting domain-containing protein [Calothrix anomala FACHB-343]